MSTFVVIGSVVVALLVFLITALSLRVQQANREPIRMTVVNASNFEVGMELSPLEEGGRSVRVVRVDRERNEIWFK